MKKINILLVSLICFVSVCQAEELSTLIAITADGSELAYEIASIQKITFVQAENSSMTIDRKGTHPNVEGVRTVLFATRYLLPTELESVADSATKVYVFPNPVQQELRVVGIEKNVEFTVYNLGGQCMLQAQGEILDVSSLPANTYFLKINNQVIKFIKK